MPTMLGLYEDVLANDAALPLPARPRMVFVVHGSVMVDGRTLHDNEGAAAQGALPLKAGAGGATIWRWELLAEDAAPAAAAAGAKAASHQKLLARLDTLPTGPLLLRGDSVAFPAGG